MRIANIVLTLMAAGMIPAVSSQPMADPLAACGEDNAAFTVQHGKIGDTQTLSPGKARIYIIELYNLADTGRLNRPTIKQGLDGSWIGATQGFSYVSADVDPGVHHLCSRWQSSLESFTDQLSLNELNAVADRRYYFRAQVVVPGASSAPPPSIDLEPVSEDEGRFLLSQAALSVSKRKK